LLVAPSSHTTHFGNQIGQGPLLGDLVRAMNFADSAINAGAKMSLEIIAQRYGLSEEQLHTSGFEMDNDGDVNTSKQR